MRGRCNLASSSRVAAPFVCGLALTLACKGGEQPLPPLARVEAKPAPESKPSVTLARNDVEVQAPRVGLDGKSHALGSTRVDGAAQVYAAAPRTWIYAAADKNSPRLGYLRMGGSVPLLERANDGWVAIAPRGYVRLDDDATLDPKHPVVRVFAEHPPDVERKLPYLYGTVRNPGPSYNGVPDAAVLAEAEPELAERIPRWLGAGGEIGASFGADLWSPQGVVEDAAVAWRERWTRAVPDYLLGGATLPTARGATDVPLGVAGSLRSKTGYALIETFFAEGRRYGVTTSLRVAPVDRLRPIRGSEFHGYQIGVDVEFPFAIVRSPIARYHDGQEATYRAALPLTGKQQFFNGVLHYETKDQRWISDRFASRIEPAKKMPKWGKQGDKWLDVSIAKQTLVAYEGEEPVFATLISSGEAGLDTTEGSKATKRGIFRIHTKHITTTMSSSEVGEEFELQDVPYVQYFEQGGYALHAAYWHDRFGVPKSHGCINLAPEDARRLFFWTAPQVPLGWHGVLSNSGTVVFVHP